MGEWLLSILDCEGVLRLSPRIGTRKGRDCFASFRRPRGMSYASSDAASPDEPPRTRRGLPGRIEMSRLLGVHEHYGAEREGDQESGLGYRAGVWGLECRICGVGGRGLVANARLSRVF